MCGGGGGEERVLIDTRIKLSTPVSITAMPIFMVHSYLPSCSVLMTIGLEGGPEKTVTAVTVME